MKDKIIAKLRTKSFWVALAGVAAMILGMFGVEDISEPLGRVVEAVGSILVLTGIVASPASESAPKTTLEAEVEPTEKDEAEKGESAENESKD